MFASLNQKYHLSFWLLLAAFSFVYQYHKVLREPAGGIHQWRQSDCLAITENYYKQDAPFFEPAINWVGASNSDKTVSDFPIIYFISGKLWSVFGQKQIIFRLINLAILFAGLFSLYKLALRFLGEKFWAVFVPLFIFTSPVIVYYGNNFLMNAPALGLTFCAWNFFFRFRESSRKRDVFLAILFFTLATLLKATAAISFISAFLIFCAEPLLLRKESMLTRKTILAVGGMFLGGFALCVGWILYAAHYNALYNQGVFLVGLLPIWKLNAAEIEATLKVLPGPYLMKQFYFFPVLILLGLMLSFNLFFTRKKNILLLTMFLLFGGFVAFFFCFFGAFIDKHDYYFIDQYVLVAFILLGFFHTVKTKFAHVFSSSAMKTVFALLLVFNLIYCKAKNNIKYFDTREGIAEKLFLEKEEVEFIEWLKWDFRTKKLTLKEAQPYIRSLGIKRNDKVLSIPDASFNITLYLLGQKGYTDIGCSDLNDGKDRIGKKIDMGADYLIIHDPDLTKIESLQPYLVHKMGTFKNVDIYDLRPFRSNAP
jgi:hypothetical protein